MELLIDKLSKTRSNGEFLAAMRRLSANKSQHFPGVAASIVVMTPSRRSVAIALLASVSIATAADSYPFFPQPN